MPISNATIGQQFTADSYFFAQDGVTPLAVSTPISFVVRNQNNLLVVQGVCTQDANNPAHWIATATIPSTATPTQSGAFYSIVFFATSSNGTGIGNQAASNTQNQTYFFTV